MIICFFYICVDIVYITAWWNWRNFIKNETLGIIHGSCAGLFTANTMNCLTEALGMGLPGNGTIPAAYTGARRQLAKRAGQVIMNLIANDIKPRDILTEKAFAHCRDCQ